MTESGAPGYGEAASGDHLQTTYRFWLVGHQLERGAALDRPPQLPAADRAQAVLGGWPFGVPFWPLVAPLRSRRRLEPASARCHIRRRASSPTSGSGSWSFRPSQPPSADRVFELAPYRLLQSGGHLLGWAAVFVPLALWAFERSRRAGSGRAAHLWGVLAAAGVVSIPLSGQLHLALGAPPFVAVYAALRYARPASLWALGGAGSREPLQGPSPRRSSSAARRSRRGGRSPRWPSTPRARPICSAAGACTGRSASSTSAGCCLSSRSPASSCWRAADAAWRSCSGSPSSSRRSSPWARTCRSTRRCATSSRRFATRAYPDASCRSRTSLWQPSRR